MVAKVETETRSSQGEDCGGGAYRCGSQAHTQRPCPRPPGSCCGTDEDGQTPATQTISQAEVDCQISEKRNDRGDSEVRQSRDSRTCGSRRKLVCESSRGRAPQVLQVLQSVCARARCLLSRQAWCGHHHAVLWHRQPAAGAPGPALSCFRDPGVSTHNSSLTC